MRVVGILYFLERFEYKEIVDILGITTSTVRTQVQRLRIRLRPLVNQFGEPTSEGEQP
jgi:DNA-directed RNA polymerase specialized sigma24 family protein